MVAMRDSSKDRPSSSGKLLNLLVTALCVCSLILFVPAQAFAWVVPEEGYRDELLFNIPSSITLVSGEQYEIEQQPGCGDSNSAVSGDETIAFGRRNSGHYYIYARRPGSTVITFANKASSVSINVTVVAGNDWSLKCKNDIYDAPIETGSSLYLKLFRSGYVDVSDYRRILSWSSSDESIVTIDHSDYCNRCSAGFGPFPYCGSVHVRGMNPGKAIVTATDENGNSRSVEVKVDWNEEEAAADWSLNPDSMSVQIEDYFIISWEGYAVGDLKPSDSRHIKSCVSSDESVVKLRNYASNAVWADAVGVGTSTITATDTYGMSRSCVVTVKQHSAVMKPVIKKQECAYSTKNEIECKSAHYNGTLYCEFWRATGNGEFRLAKAYNEEYGIPDWVDKGRKPNTKYRYKVRYSVDGGKSFGPFSEAVTFWTAPKRNATGVKKNGSAVSWSKVSGATGYCAFMESDRFLGYNIFGGKVYQNTVRGVFTTSRSATRKWVDGYERVTRVATYAKHGGYYYADGEDVVKKRSNIFVTHLGSHRWHT